MATFPVIGSSEGETRGGATRGLGEVDTVELATRLVEIRDDFGTVLEDTNQGLSMKSLTLKLTLTAEGKIAFIAKGSVQASIEVVFERP